MKNTPNRPEQPPPKEEKKEYTPIIERIRAIAEYKKQRITTFEVNNGMSPGYLSKVKNPGSDILSTILDNNMEISEIWLLTGRGDMLVSMVDSSEFMKVEEVAPVHKSYEIATRSLPVFDVYGHAGRTSLVNTMEEAPILAYVRVPGYEDCLGWVRVKGDCMAPFLKNGDYVALKKGDRDNIAWGRAYFIVFGGDNPLENEVKYIRKGKDAKHWILRSHDEDKYEDQEIHKDLIRDVYRVRGGIIDI